MSWTSKWRMPNTRLPAFTDHREGFRQQIVEGFAFIVALAEFGGLSPQGFVGEAGQRRLQGVDAPNGRGILLDQPIVAAAENLLSRTGNHRRRIWGPPKRAKGRF